MREAPFRIALFSIFITVVRIALFVFVIDSGYGVMLGRIFAVAFAFIMAAGTYLSAFAVRFKNSQTPGIVGLVVFGLGDLLFNEAAVIYVTSSATLIPPESNFLHLTSDELLYGMQVLTLIFGAMPTIAAAVLGWMQASFYKVAELNKAGIFGKIASAIGKSVTGWVAGFGIRFGSADNREGNVPRRNGKISPRRWGSLTADECANVPRMSRAQMMALFGISDGASGEWKRRIESGERPYQKVMR